ncbi:MAG TPA: MBOAT family O-acyltransferase [Candidatus Binatia bacterium]|nr:MBOAT family O-acyltransferase [Candidatus Binatia bacterium]
MWFDTPAYILFLVLVVLAYWRLPRLGQNILLLGASYLFYGWWDYRFLLLMIGSTTVDFFIGQAIQRSQNRSSRRFLLIVSLVVNFAVLGLFKYFNFFVDSFAHVLGAVGVTASMPLLRIILPPGISFYTFQEVAYIVDVYKKKLPAAESFFDYALFISLFPHLIAGPIQRPSHLLPQVQKERTFQSDKFFDGILLILSGLFRKCVIADNCALIANAAFSGSLGRPNIFTVALGAYAFAWQIYGDFSGYSDIARGSAQLLGFHFMVNFRQPYLSTSIQDFWRRWHISLSTWLRDYLYIPLGGSARKGYETYRNLLLTMLLGGLWHGANWTFVVWGWMHGVALGVERYVRGIFSASSQHSAVGTPIHRPFAETKINWTWPRRVFVFHFVCLSWIFFRAESMHAALSFLRGLGRFEWNPEYLVAFKFLGLFALPLFALDLFLENSAQEYLLQERTPLARIAIAACAVAVIAFFSANEANAFIYFQF